MCYGQNYCNHIDIALCTSNTHIRQAIFKLSLGIADLVDSFGELEIDNDFLLVDVVCSLLQDTIDDAPESAGGVALLFRLQDVFIGERAPLVRSDRAGRETERRGLNKSSHMFYLCYG